MCTEQSPKESDDTRCCTNTIVLLKMNTVVLETRRCNKCIKEFKHKAGKKYYHYIRMNGQQNIQIA